MYCRQTCSSWRSSLAPKFFIYSLLRRRRSSNVFGMSMIDLPIWRRPSAIQRYPSPASFPVVSQLWLRSTPWLDSMAIFLAAFPETIVEAFSWRNDTSARSLLPKPRSCQPLDVLAQVAQERSQVVVLIPAPFIIEEGTSSPLPRFTIKGPDPCLTCVLLALIFEYCPDFSYDELFNYSFLAELNILSSLFSCSTLDIFSSSVRISLDSTSLMRAAYFSLITFRRVASFQSLTSSLCSMFCTDSLTRNLCVLEKLVVFY